MCALHGSAERAPTGWPRTASAMSSPNGARPVWNKQTEKSSRVGGGRDSVFGKLLENSKDSGLYVPNKMIEREGRLVSMHTAPFVEALRALHACLSPEEAARQKAEEEAEKQQRRRQWGEDMRTFFVNNGTRIDLSKGEVLVDGEGHRNAGLDSVYFVLQGVVVERCARALGRRLGQAPYARRESPAQHAPREPSMPRGSPACPEGAQHAPREPSPACPEGAQHAPREPSVPPCALELDARWPPLAMACSCAANDLLASERPRSPPPRSRVPMRVILHCTLFLCRQLG